MYFHKIKSVKKGDLLFVEESFDVLTPFFFIAIVTEVIPEKSYTDQINFIAVEPVVNLTKLFLLRRHRYHRSASVKFYRLRDKIKNLDRFEKIDEPKISEKVSNS